MLGRGHQWRQLLKSSFSPTVQYSTASKEISSRLVSKEKDTPHHDLKSFDEYASRVGLDRESSMYVGTRYEYTVSQSLERLGFELKKVGGRSDYGIDLLGTWNVPAVQLSLKVLVQCKAIAKKTSPNMVRELEGAFAGAPLGWRGNGVLGLLITKNSATQGIRDALARSRWPMGFALCTAEGRLLQLLWNMRAEEEGLIGVGVGLRHSQARRAEKEICLIWKGSPIKDQRPVSS